jgi:hypothetical protein
MREHAVFHGGHADLRDSRRRSRPRRSATRRGRDDPDEDEIAPEVREACFGSARAKNVALWASPFETFLLVDADTIVWGDMRTAADFERYDFVVDRPGVEPTYSVMDVERVAAGFAASTPRGTSGSYVNNGVYFGRRGLLDLECYLDAVRAAREQPGMLYGSQGPFNYMLLQGS